MHIFKCQSLLTEFIITLSFDKKKFITDIINVICIHLIYANI
jgi:hypothetical protein